MKETNLTPSSRLTGRCCFSEFVSSRAAVLLLIFLLPIVGIAQEKRSQKASHQEQLEMKEANYQAWLAQQKTASEATQATEEAPVVLDEYQILLQEYNIDEQKYLDNGFTKEDILAEINSIKDSDMASEFARQGSGACATAEPLSCGDGPVSGSTNNYGVSGFNPCGGLGLYGDIVWYKVVGNGAPNTASIVTSSMTYPEIHVFSSTNGDCNTLSCYGTNNGSTSVDFYAAFEDIYYIAIGDGFYGSGNYTIELTSLGDCAPPADGLTAATAYPTECGNVETGSTVGVTATEVPATCGTSNSSSGVWYTFTATAGTPEDISVRTCNSDYDSKLTVYSGAPGSLNCIGGDDDDFSTYCFDNDGFVDFTADLDVTYYIYVSGFSTSVGNYQLSVICDGNAVTPPPSAPANDVCPEATVLDCGDTLTDQTTIAANLENTSTCGFSVGPDVWYVVEGSGDEMYVELTPDGGSAEVEIYESIGDCTDFTLGSCLENDTFTGSGSTLSLPFQTSIDSYYYIRVAVSTPTGTPFDFSIGIICPTPPANDDCTGATAISCDSTTDDNMIGAGVSTQPFCVTSTYGPGRWYSFTGTGGPMILDSQGSTMYNKIFLFSGSCGALACEGVSTTSSFSTSSTISLSSVAGQTYYVHIAAGSTTSTLGAYTLNLTCPPDPCDTAEEISCADDVVYGNTSGANGSPISPNLCGDTDDSQGVMLKFVADATDDKLVKLNTCGSSYDTSLNVYSGSCGALACLTYNDDIGFGSDTCDGTGDTSSLRSAVQFLAEAGQTYYVWVTGYGSSTGDFQLNIDCGTVEGNDLCGDAFALACGSSYTGNTSLSTERDAPDVDCSESNQDIGVGTWFTVAGTGGDIEVSVCDTDFDAKLLVFTGDCENGLFCYDGSNDGNGCGVSDQPSVLLTNTTPGETYTLYVTGDQLSSFSGSDNGTFTISVDCACYNPNAGVISCETIYQGYDDPIYNSVTLEPTVLYATPPITYSWSHDASETGSSIVVTAPDDVPGIYSQNYSVTMTDADGCTTSQEWFVQVVDIDCDRNNNNDKITLCHNGNTICVSVAAAATHLQHGDMPGACGTDLCDEITPQCDVTVTSPADGATFVELDTTIEWTGATGLVTNYNVSIYANGVEVLNQDVGNVLSLNVSLSDYDTEHTVTVTPSNSIGDAPGCQTSTFTTRLDPSIILCGEGLVSNYTYCYTAFDNSSFYYQSFDGGPLTLEFNQGYVESNTFDDLIIYEGTDASGTVLWSNGSSSITNLGGTIVTAASGQIFMTITSDSSVQCDGVGGSRVWDYDVYCGAPPPPGCNDMNVNISTGSFGSEVSWNIKDSGGATVASGSGYSSSSNYDISVNLPDGNYTFEMIDSYGDGWNGGTYTLTDGYNNVVSSGGLTSGYFGSNPFTVDCANAEPPSCNDAVVNLTTVSYGSEVSWEILDAGSSVVASGSGYSSGSSYSIPVSLPDGTYSFVMIDSYGDGWNGGSFNVTDGLGSVIASGALTSGYTGTVPFTVACGSARDINQVGSTTTHDWSMAPNPTRGNVTLDLGNYLRNTVSVQVVDFTGKVISTTEIDELQTAKYTLELSNSLPAGMYFVRVTSGTQASAKKLMIMK